MKGLQKVTFLLNKREYTHRFSVCSLPTGVLGTDFLEKLGAVIDVESGKMSLSYIGRAPKEYSGSPAKYTAQTVLIRGGTQKKTRFFHERLIYSKNYKKFISHLQSTLHLNSASWMLFSTLVEAAITSSKVLNRHPFKSLFIRGNKKKSAGARSGE